MGKREREYIRDTTDIPYCCKAFNVSLTSCDILCNDDPKKLTFLTRT